MRLWRAGASVYAAEDYGRYRERFKTARAALDRESAKLSWFRDYEAVQAELRSVLDFGHGVLDRVEGLKKVKAEAFGTEVGALTERILELQDITLRLNEKGAARRALARAELILAEAQALNGKAAFDALPGKLEAARSLIGLAETVLSDFLERFQDPVQVETWKRWVERTIEGSRRDGTAALVVNKIEGNLTVYRAGRPVRRFSVGLGMNGFSDKLHSGDNATPEGFYKVIKKIPRSQFYKALLIDYPNDEDKARFERAKKEGRLEAGAGIGGLIEIHGGGQDSLTRGCISLEDSDMDTLFAMVAVGVPVTIVGSLTTDLPIFDALGKKTP
ncbi:MAG: L,D-transpeptidase [Candidatus Aminicenantes bacterium]|nr:L,D-transpeptidase [Candidatus Aminicenantes bacterium]